MRTRSLLVAVLLVLAITTALFAHQIRVLNDNRTPKLDLCSCAIDSTGRLWATGFRGIPSQIHNLYSFDGDNWTDHGSPRKEMLDIVVDKNNRKWLMQFHDFYDANLYYYTDELFNIYGYNPGGAFAINPITGNLWFAGYRGRSHGVWEYNEGEIIRRHDFNPGNIAFGDDGNYAYTRQVSRDSVVIEMCDSNGVVVAVSNAFENRGAIITYPNSLVYNRSNSSFYMVGGSSGRYTLHRFDGIETTPIHIDTCSFKSIMACTAPQKSSII